jgi:enterochelin esterase-like enzyme
MAILLCTSALATLGWTTAATANSPSAVEIAGARTPSAPAAPAPASRPPGPRERDAWQPSPIAVAGRQSQDPAWREVTFHSDALNRDMPYLVWLPPGYERSTVRYPTLYLLHGAGDGAAAGRFEWQGLGVAKVLSDLVAQGAVQPMLIILPEGEQGYWINQANNGPRWADYVARDVVAHVDRTFQTDPKPTRRAIGGLSMGGHGSMQLALNYPDVFRIAGAHTPSIRDYEQSPPFFGDPAWYARYDPRALARNSGAARGLTAWVDFGTRDRWRKGAQELADALKAGGAKVEVQTPDGAHEGAYWRAHIPDYLRFYSQALGGPTSK